MPDEADLPDVYDGPSFEEAGGDEGEVATTEVDAPTEGGQGGETVPTDDAPSASYLSDEFYDRIVKVKIDGEEVEVPVSELTQGYSRHADYTRKTQEIAEERQQLQWERAIRESLQADPQGTIAYLQSQFAQAQEPEMEWPEDPLERALLQQRMEFEQQLAPLRQDHAAREVERTVGALQARYGEDFDAKSVIAEAVRRGYDDPRVLESVYKELAFDRLMAAHEAQQTVASQKAADTAQREQAKSQIVSHSGGSQVTPPTTPNHSPTLREAFDMALQQHGQR